MTLRETEVVRFQTCGRGIENILSLWVAMWLTMVLCSVCRLVVMDAVVLVWSCAKLLLDFDTVGSIQLTKNKRNLEVFGNYILIQTIMWGEHWAKVPPMNWELLGDIALIIHDKTWKIARCDQIVKQSISHWLLWAYRVHTLLVFHSMIKWPRVEKGQSPYYEEIQG